MTKSSSRYYQSILQEHWALLFLAGAIFVPITIFLIFVSSEKPSPNLPSWSSTNSLVEITPFSILDDFNQDSLIAAVEGSISYYKRFSPDHSFRFGKDLVTAEHLCHSLEEFRDKVVELGPSQELSNYVISNYRFYKSSGSKILFTGYFEASLNGSLTRTDVFQYPLYKKPSDLAILETSDFPQLASVASSTTQIRVRVTEDNRILPYYSRKEIDTDNVLANRGLELVWTDSIVDAFFLQIQGSGVVTLPDASQLRLGYAEKNGHPYRPIGKLLIDQGLLTRENVSMQSIKKYLQSHPEGVDDVLNYNPSYVFFRETPHGPLGNIEVPLTPMRSIATDYRLFPKGSLAFVRTKIPEFDASNNIIAQHAIGRFVLNQDTGGAIRGPGRVDLFTGNGPTSELVAGHLNQSGELYFLVKR